MMTGRSADGKGAQGFRRMIARGAAAHGAEPRQVSFQGAFQTILVFQNELRHAGPCERTRLMEAMLRAIVSHRVGGRPNRVEPCASNRRPKPKRFLKKPRDQTRKRLQIKQ